MPNAAVADRSIASTATCATRVVRFRPDSTSLSENRDRAGSVAFRFAKVALTFAERKATLRFSDRLKDRKTGRWGAEIMRLHLRSLRLSTSSNPSYRPADGPHQPGAGGHADKRHEHRQIAEVVREGGGPKQAQRDNEQAQEPPRAAVAERRGHGRQQQRAAGNRRRLNEFGGGMRESQRKVPPFVAIQNQLRRVVGVVRRIGCRRI